MAGMRALFDTSETDADSLDERLVTTDWLTDEMFSWKNLVLLFITVLIFLASKGMFVAPFYFRTFATDKKAMKGKFTTLDRALVEDDNKGMAAQFAGFLLGVGLVVRGSLSTPKSDIGDALLDCFVFSIIGFMLIGISHVITDFAILWKINSIVSVAVDKNTAVGVMVGLMHIASGAILGWSITETADDIGEQIGATFIWWILGHFFLVVFAWVYMLITAYDDLKLISQDKVSAALGFGMVLIANALLIASPISKSDEILAVVISWGLGSIALIGLRIMIDLVILRGRKLDDEIEEDDNWGAALIEGVSSVAFAIMWWALYRADKSDECAADSTGDDD